MPQSVMGDGASNNNISAGTRVYVICEIKHFVIKGSDILFPGRGSAKKMGKGVLIT